MSAPTFTFRVATEADVPLTRGTGRKPGSGRYMPLLRALQADGPQAVTIEGDPETFAAGLRAQARYFKQRVSVWRVSDADYLVRIVGPKS